MIGINLQPGFVASRQPLPDRIFGVAELANNAKSDSTAHRPTTSKPDGTFEARASISRIREVKKIHRGTIRLNAIETAYRMPVSRTLSRATRRNPECDAEDVLVNSQPARI
ncbi:MAG: hypothetical protein IPK00_02230 [Deltaproteobacteria bacterium]|nr:hypothetical protein [Deltaproteobacteria bacterium]